MQQIVNAVYEKAVLWCCFGCPFLRICDCDEDDIFEEEFSAVGDETVFFVECLFSKRNKLGITGEPHCYPSGGK